MKFQDKLRKTTRDDIWSEYCGFLDLSLTEYMFIQRRLMQEQIQLWKSSGLGRLLLGGKNPETLDEFREIMPLTNYEDYAEILLSKRSAMLPEEPVVWVQSTWEGGLRPLKLAPYTRAMLDSYKHNILSAVILAACSEKGDIRIKPGDRILFGGAPLPYATGLLPSLLAEEIDLHWLPEISEKSQPSFSQRLKKGFDMAFAGGFDFLFSIGNAADFITSNFPRNIDNGGKRPRMSPYLGLKYLKARYIGKRDGKTISPGEIFKLKGIICSGTDSSSHRKKITDAWGIAPIEISIGTEASCIAVEGIERQGMYFFPDACFYEFIPESETIKSLSNPDYKPRTCLMDEVSAGENYELVISVLHGGAFMRYRVGDMYRCCHFSGGDSLPRFTYIDKVPSVIDISGFTHLTQSSIEEVFRISRMGIGQWLAKKEYDPSGNPFLHLYIEILPDSQENDVVNKATLTEHFSVYFEYFDSDYGDLKQLLSTDPLQITVLKYGSIDHYNSISGRVLQKMNPSNIDIAELMKFQLKARSGLREEAAAR